MKILKSFRFIISGKVQGVYYRKTIKENAIKFKFCGYVKNLPDKTVEVVVTCEENRLIEFISIIKRGSTYSKVNNIKQTLIKEVYTNGFKVKY